RRHTRSKRDWSSDVCSSDLIGTPYTDSASEEPTGSSKRTVNRLIRGKTREMVDELTSVVFPAVDFDRPDGAIYDDEELLLLETRSEERRVGKEGRAGGEE